MTNDLVAAKPKGSHLFQRGQSGNPNGRPKGSKNAITLIKLAIESELRARMRGDMAEVISKGLEMAKAGDKDLIKFFTSLWVSPARASGDEDAPRDRVQIVIGRLNDEKQVTGRIIEHGAITDGNEVS